MVPVAKSMFALTAGDFDEHDMLDIADPSTMPTGQAPLAPLTKGELIFIEASGMIKNPAGQTFDANGELAIGGVDMALTNRQMYALFGTIGQNVFLVGDSLALLAPEAGNLQFLINACLPGAVAANPQLASLCPVTGSFHITVHRKPHVTIADNPPVTDNTVASTVNFSLNANAGWTDTGAHLTRGQKVFIHASGNFTANGTTYGPDGDPGGADGGTAYLLSNHLAYRLFGQVNGNVIDIGADTSFLSPDDGELNLAINQSSDATGSIAAVIGLGVVPSRGLLSCDISGFTQHQTLDVANDATWQATKITVNKGDPILVTATGQLPGNSFSNGQPVDAFGLSAWGGTSMTLSNRPIWALFGRVGGEIFYLGGQQVLLAPAAGTLDLLINTSQSCATSGGDPTWCVSGNFTATLQAP